MAKRDEDAGGGKYTKCIKGADAASSGGGDDATQRGAAEGGGGEEMQTMDLDRRLQRLESILVDPNAGGGCGDAHAEEMHCEAAGRE